MRGGAAGVGGQGGIPIILASTILPETNAQMVARQIMGVHEHPCEVTHWATFCRLLEFVVRKYLCQERKP